MGPGGTPEEGRGGGVLECSGGVGLPLDVGGGGGAGVGVGAGAGAGAYFWSLVISCE